MSSEETDIVQLSNDFHSLYRTFHLTKNEKKRKDKPSKSKSKRIKPLVDSATPVLPTTLPTIEILGNSSYFATYASVRQLVLEYNFAESCRKWLISLDDRSTEKEAIADKSPSPISLPKIVGIGLEAVFHLIQESYEVQPALCVKALEALLNVLDGQNPQSLRKEPTAIIDSMFYVLLHLSKTGSGIRLNSSTSTKLSTSSQLTSLATSCLISLAIARGDTKSILEAIQSLFDYNESTITENIKNPEILKVLGKCTQAILVGRAILPQWLTRGIPNNACVDSFKLNFPEDPSGCVYNAKTLASDGCYLYLHCSRGLFKIGSGCFGAVRGRIYASDEKFHNSDKCWLGCANGKLYYHLLKPNELKMYMLSTETLQVVGSFNFSENISVTFFTDGSHLGYIIPSREDGFLVRTMSNETFDPKHYTNEFNIRLVRKSVAVSGPGPWDADTGLRPIVTGVDEDVAFLTAGKDFALLRTQHGRILYCGKGSSLGQKSGISKFSKWSELAVSKCSRFVQCAVGHEGIHALLLAEDGGAYFVGTPKRGEDGDQAKARKVAKASKPKKVIRMEGQDVAYVACNNGTSAFVTRSGDAYMFGKDTAHCDPVSGFLTGLRGIFVSQIAMGKAHSIILSGDGKVFTMGMNNRGQCGRSLPSAKEDEIFDEDETEWDESASSGVVVGPGVLEQEGICPSGSHRWKHEQCMVCTICRECTGYGSACISALRPDRNPGQECGCGVGEAGCAECGSCRTCAREGLDDADFLVLEHQRGAAAADPELADAARVDENAGAEEPPERRVAKPGSSLAIKPRKEGQMTVSTPPTRLNLPTTNPIIQVSCGLYHSVFLDSKGVMFVCGSNSVGQLGVGDILPRQSPVKVRFSEEVKIVQIAAGSYHTVALDSNGVVYTAGANSRGQLGRDEENHRFASLLPIESTGVRHGRRVTWIGATGDSTFLRLEASLISPKILKKSTVTANASVIMIIPPPLSRWSSSSIMINRKDGYCSYFEGDNHWCVTTSAIVLDPTYDFLWTCEWQERIIKCHNVVASSVRNPKCESNMWLLKPPFAVPIAANTKLERWQAGANLLACIDTLVATQVQNLSIQPEEEVALPALSKLYTRDDYAAVCRFENHGGGWGYSGHSVEAIRFSCDTDILLGGFGVFGGRGEYCAKIKVFDIGIHGGEIEQDGELLAETEEIPYDCGPRQKFRIMFEEPIPLQANRWYVAWAHISGPSSDCGSNGQATVLSEDQVTFHFKSSKKSNNGTDLNAGQIPLILYHLMSSDLGSMGSSQKQQIEPVHILSTHFLSNFNHSCLKILSELLQWCQTATMEPGTLTPLPEDEFRLNILKFVACSSLRLLEFSINQAYPFNGCGRPGTMESMAMAEAIGDVRSVLQAIVQDDVSHGWDYLEEYGNQIANQCCETFINCFQVFYPTPTLKWECFAHFLFFEVEEAVAFKIMNVRLFSSVVCALFGCRGQLLSIFPVLSSGLHHSPDETSLTFITNTEGGKPKPPSNNRLLVSQMSERNKLDYDSLRHGSFWNALRRLLRVVEYYRKEDSNVCKTLVHNCSILLGKLMEELVSHACGAYGELEDVIGQVVVATPNRFTRTNQSRTWNTGNGSPDAVSFTVNQTGVSIFGAWIYSGTGSYEYDLELFQEADENSEVPSDQADSKWVLLEAVHGNFDSDDCVGDVSEIRFARSAHIKPGVKYALRLKNQGGRTCNGDGGVSILRCPDGTTFSFASCSLSFNGTNQIRGQIPHILYFRNPDDSDSKQKAKLVGEMEARKCAIQLCRFIFKDFKNASETEFASGNEALFQMPYVTTLFPSILAHLPKMANSDPRSSVELLELIREILPNISSINNGVLVTKPDRKLDSCAAVHFAWVESPHPYKSATLTQYRVTFPSTVQRLVVEFDPRCCTAQPEDSLRIYIPFRNEMSANVSNGDGQEFVSPYIPVMDRYFGNSNWPQKAVVLPGNELLFSLETASDYVRAEKSQYFGFRCLVSGFEWKECSGLVRAEMELAYLGGFCVHELIKKELVLPPVSAEEVKVPDHSGMSEEKVLDICLRYYVLFSKGIGLEYFPTVQEALDGIVPLREKSKEQEFIADFIARTPATSGERLANWLQPESFVDPEKCEVILPSEKLRRGVSTTLILVTRDQYGDPVIAQNLQVELKAVPLKSSYALVSTYVPFLPDVLPDGQCLDDIPYQVTVKDKMRYHAITLMKEFENYSFEELRQMSPTARRNSESMLVRQNSDATYTATWTPATCGNYKIALKLDGYAIPQICSVNVEKSSEIVDTFKREDQTFKTATTSKMRKFKATDSAGLRIRSHPTLQSEQIGCLPVDAVITFTSEVHNDDGIWIKLDENSLSTFCKVSKRFHQEGWCLQYNQHLGKTFLFPVQAPKPLPGSSGEKNSQSVRKLADFSFSSNTENSSSKALRLNGSPKLYQVVKCGVSGHNIRTRPCLSSPPVGILVMGSKFYVIDECYNGDGLWLKLDAASRRKFCFTSDGDGWSLAVNRNEVVYLKRYESQPQVGFDFSVASQTPQNVFQNVVSSTIFGSGEVVVAGKEEQYDHVPTSASQTEYRPSIEQPAAEIISKKGPSEKSTENTTLPEIPAKSEFESPPKTASTRSRSSSTFGALQKWLQLGTDGGPFSRPISTTSQGHHRASVLEASKSLVKERIHALSSSMPSTTCSATQTSPMDDYHPMSLPTVAQFSIGSGGKDSQGGSEGVRAPPLGKSPKLDRKLAKICSSLGTGKPKSNRKDRDRSDKGNSASIDFNDITSITGLPPFKEAIGPAQAQGQRAVFGAVLWHSGIIHDAMACSSFLRFKKQTSLNKVDPQLDGSGARINSNIGGGVFGSTTMFHKSDLKSEHSASLDLQKNTKEDMESLNKSSVDIKSECDAAVTYRKKRGNTETRDLSQRYSVEVTSAAMLLKGNPDLTLEPLFSATTQCQHGDGAIEGLRAVPNVDDSEEFPIVVALYKIWKYVKKTCTESSLREASENTFESFSKSKNSKFKKERKVSRGTMDHNIKTRRERPKELQSVGRSFLLEPEGNNEFLDEMQRCEICQCRFSTNGKSRKTCFGLSSLCESCSEKQLKIKKQQVLVSSSKLSSTPVTFDLNLRNLSPTEYHNAHSVILNNALFLLQMINNPPDLQSSCYLRRSSTSSVKHIPPENSFSCYTALGVTQSQIEVEEDAVQYEHIDSPFHVSRVKPAPTKPNLNVQPANVFELPDGLPRRRKASNGDKSLEESGFHLLSRPSPILQKIVSADSDASEEEALTKFCGSVVSFVTERHDLDALKLSLFQAIRRISCRSYGMQMLSWLMRNVSQTTSLHDLFWWYGSSLGYIQESSEDGTKPESLDNGWWEMRRHPLTEFPASIFPILSESLYTLLQTIADIIPYLPVGGPLLEMAVKCWGVSFPRKDHKFLHRSKIFRHLSQIMSQFDGENEWSKSSLYLENQECEPENTWDTTTIFDDVTSSVEVKVSSRSALCPSLTDESTETFWESGDEDRNRTKSITLTTSVSDVNLKVVGVHVDNGRDSQFKVSSLSVKCGPNPDELVRIGNTEIDSRHCGWSWFSVESHVAKAIRIDCKGPDNTLRVRQVKVLGLVLGKENVSTRSDVSALIARRKCENETLRIFRLLSSEVFGKLLSSVKRRDDDADSNDLQEHVVGILFSRNKLTHLQKQVCSHIVSAIHREAIKIKHEFDSFSSRSVLEVANDNIRLMFEDKPKILDRYCFEMLSLVLALAGSKVGRSYLSQQSNLIQDLMQLLHAGTPRIQRQVILVLRKILPEINPEDFSKIVCCYEIQPSGDFISRLGVLDLLLGCIAKSLYVKVRASGNGNSRETKQISLQDVLSKQDFIPDLYWFLRGQCESQLASTIVKLIKDMSEASFSEEWSLVTKPAIAQAVLDLTRIEPHNRNSDYCFSSPKFWISLAALCVLHEDHSKELSSQLWQNGSNGRAKCANHDDGETFAVIQCKECGDLCSECDRILHLPKKSWNHTRKVCKEEEESIRVDLHEGCGRIKLFWLMALGDSSTLKTLVEFRTGIPKTFTDSLSSVSTVGRCRFCNKTGSSGPLALGNVCGEIECQEYAKNACEKVLDCGHACGGVKNEAYCLPCLQGCSEKLGSMLKQDNDDMCMICFTDALAFAPAIQLSCGHVFHYHCCRSILERRWAGPRITFAFSQCPICKAGIAHPLLDDVLNPIRELFLDVQRKALLRLEYEGLNKTEAIMFPGGRFFEDAAGYAMDRYAYYVCFKCQKAYFGGEARCDVEIQLEFDPQELVCGACSDVSQAQLCPKHGTDYLEYKCRYCCSVAVFFCFGTTHFCNGCHDDFQRITVIPKNQLPHCPAGPRAKQLEVDECPLHVTHPPTGEEFALGCGICRNAHTF